MGKSDIKDAFAKQAMFESFLHKTTSNDMNLFILQRIFMFHSRITILLD